MQNKQSRISLNITYLSKQLMTNNSVFVLIWNLVFHRLFYKTAEIRIDVEKYLVFVGVSTKGITTNLWALS